MTASLQKVVKEKIGSLQKKLSDVKKKIFNSRQDNEAFEIVKDYLDEKLIIESQIEDLLESINETQINGQVGKKYQVEVNNSKRNYYIVTPKLANPMEGHISIDSPLAKALSRAKPGETVDVEAPAGVLQYKILGFA